MALTKTAAKFEAMDEDGNEIEVMDAEEVSKPTADERVAAAVAKNAPKVNAVVAQKPAGGAVSTIARSNPYTEMQDALRVDYNTLTRLMATNGNFQNKENKKLLGDTIGFELISYQDNYVMSPGGESDDKESIKYLRYSDDGKVSKEGECMFEALRLAKEAGYDGAKISRRVLLVGSLFNPGKQTDMQDDIVQMDLAPNSVKNWTQHQIGVAFKVGKGLIAKEGTERLKLEIIVKDENKLQWSEVGFSLWK